MPGCCPGPQRVKIIIGGGFDPLLLLEACAMRQRGEMPCESVPMHAVSQMRVAQKGWSCSSSRSLFLSQHPCCLKSRPNSIWCAEGVADLTPYGDKLKFISHSTYCIEGVGDLIPDKNKLLGLGTRRALPVCVYIYVYNR